MSKISLKILKQSQQEKYYENIWHFMKLKHDRGVFKRLHNVVEVMQHGGKHPLSQLFWNMLLASNSKWAHIFQKTITFLISEKT